MHVLCRFGWCVCHACLSCSQSQNNLSIRQNDIAVVFLQSCDSEEDGLFAFDMHSDGEGQR